MHRPPGVGFWRGHVLLLLVALSFRGEGQPLVACRFNRVRARSRCPGRVCHQCTQCAQCAVRWPTSRCRYMCRRMVALTTAPAPRCVHVRKAYAEAAPRLEALRQYESQKKQARQRALLELKNSTDASYAKVCAENDWRVRKRQQQKFASEAEAKTTRRRADNPYIEVRMRQAATLHGREEALRLARRRDAEVRILNVLLREEDHARRRAGTQHAVREK